MPLLHIDFESYSEVDIKEAGGKAYAHHDSTQIICMAWAFDQEEPELWTVASGPLPERIVQHIENGHPVAAFNATFDWRIWNLVGCNNFDWPPLLATQLVDVQALCAAYQLPQNLGDAGEALRIPMPKDKAGANLIKMCCIPDRHGEQPLPTSPSLVAAFNNLFRYCKRDVKAMQQIVYKLPRQELIPQEQEIWLFTLEMNERGLPVDIDSVRAVYNYLQTYIEKTVVELPVLTKGYVQTPGQIAKIIKWCCDNGHILPNLQAETLEVELMRPSLPANIRRVLELRQELGRSSTAKYKKIQAQAIHLPHKKGYWVYDNLRYHGAGTGRWTGQGFQMHNLPRLSVHDICEERNLVSGGTIELYTGARPANPNAGVDPSTCILRTPVDFEDPDTWFSMFRSGFKIDNPVKVAKALIRPIVKAPEGWKLAVADYSSIENMLLAWAANDYETLEDFKHGKDQYKTMASARYGVPYDEVTKEQRRMGKVIILGCGYGMGAIKFQDTALRQFGLEMSKEESIASVNAYRERYSLVKGLWKALHRAATECVISGQKRKFKNTTFGMFSRNGINWLAMLLPTGKALYYMDPTIKEELIKDYEFMGPVPTITHWGINPYSKKWSRLKLIPGRITENFIQATAREVMAAGMLRVKKEMPFSRAIGSVHDEALTLFPEKEATPENMDKFCKTLSDVDFVPGCPIKAVGFYTDRYKKE